MARLSRAQRLLRNSEAALLSAIEIYNKPTFAYREETFSILALNAWELLLKAKLLEQSGNNPKCLRVYYFKKNASGVFSKKPSIKTNRTGNELTVSISETANRLDRLGIKLAASIRLNIDGLIQVRDNAIHYINASPKLAKAVLEIGTAAVQNFVALSKEWFNLDLSYYSLYLMPIGFVPGTKASAVFVSPDEAKVIDYLSRLVAAGDPGASSFNVALDVAISMNRSTSAAATPIVFSDKPGAIPVVMSEEEFHKIFKWDYDELTTRLKTRYSDFRLNNDYHSHRKAIIAGSPHLMSRRYLDPIKKGGGHKDWYNPEILAEFDKVYTPLKKP